MNSELYEFIYLVISFLLTRNNEQVIYEPIYYKNSSSKKWNAS